MKFNIEIREYKKIKDFKGSFIPGQLYLVKGNNDQGKTSFCQAIMTLLTAQNNVKTPVNFDATKGEIKGMIEDFKDVDGNTYRFSWEFDTENTKGKFTFVDPEAKITKSVTSIRDFFQFNNFTTEEFLSWGGSAEGRRKQAKILYDLLPEDIKEKITNIDAQINEKDGVLYLKRRNANTSFESLQNSLSALKISEDDVKILLKKEKATKLLETLKNTIADIETQSAAYSDVRDVKKSLDDLQKEIAEGLPLASGEITAYMVNIEKVIDAHYPKPDISKLQEYKQRIEDGQALITKIAGIESRKQTYIENQKKMQVAMEERDTLSKRLDALRQEKKDLFAGVEIDPRLAIEDSELYYKMNDKLTPFDKNSVSYSISGLIVTDFICRLNKKSQIAIVGMASEYDKESLNKLDQLAKKHNFIIFADYVMYEPTPLEVKMHEPK